MFRRNTRKFSDNFGKFPRQTVNPFTARFCQANRNKTTGIGRLKRLSTLALFSSHGASDFRPGRADQRGWRRAGMANHLNRINGLREYSERAESFTKRVAGKTGGKFGMRIIFSCKCFSSGVNSIFTEMREKGEWFSLIWIDRPFSVCKRGGDET
jgi:hypothetical protein